MTPAERRERERKRVFQLGWDNAASLEPLTDEEIVRIAFLIAPTIAAVPRAVRPLPAAA